MKKGRGVRSAVLTVGLITVALLAFMLFETWLAEQRKSPIEKSVRLGGSNVSREMAPYWEIKKEADKWRGPDVAPLASVEEVIRNDMNDFFEGSYWSESDGKFFNGANVIIPVEQSDSSRDYAGLSFKVLKVTDQLCEQLVGEHIRKSGEVLEAKEKFEVFLPWYDSIVILKKDSSKITIQPKKLRELTALAVKKRESCQNASSLIFVGL